MRWFKHDADANSDAKLKRVRIKYGLEGYGLYWYCLELIAGDVSKDKITFELEHDSEIIAHDTGIHYQRVQEMMTFMVNLGLFQRVGGVIRCIKMAQRIDQSMTSNPEMRRIIERFKDDSHDGVMVESCVGHDGVMTESAKPMQDKTRLDYIKDLSSDNDVPAPKKTVNKKKDLTPYQYVVDSYHERLPMLPGIQKLTPVRKRHIKQRYDEVIENGADITYFDRFFDHVSGCNDFVLSSSWCNLEWLMKENNFVKVSEAWNRA